MLAALDMGTVIALGARYLQLKAAGPLRLWHADKTLLALSMAGALAAATGATLFRRSPPKTPDRLGLTLLGMSLAIAAAFGGFFPAAIMLNRESRYLAAPAVETLFAFVVVVLVNIGAWGLWLALSHSARGQPEKPGPGVPPAFAWSCTALVGIACVLLWTS